MNRYNVTILFAFYMHISSYVKAQGTLNYALNGSFEDISKCPEREGDIVLAKHYYQSIGTTTDLFARCGSPNVGVPKNRVGVMDAYDGNNMAGIIATTKGYSYYDYIIGTLDYKNMIPGHSYCVSMKVSLAYQSPWALDQLAVTFCDSNSWKVLKYSNGQTFYSNPLNSNYPSTALGQDQNLSVRDKWITIKGEITYIEGMKYFWIGANWKAPKSLTPVNDVQQVFNPDRTVYYYVDDIKIVESSNDSLRFNVTQIGGCDANRWKLTLNADPDSVLWYLDGNFFHKGNSGSLDFPFNLDIMNIVAHAYYREFCNPLVYTTDPTISYKAPFILNDYYPNPTAGREVKLNIYQKGKIWSTIYDISGRKIRELEFPAQEKFNTIVIPVAELTIGIYLIETRSTDCYWIGKVLVE